MYVKKKQLEHIIGQHARSLYMLYVGNELTKAMEHMLFVATGLPQVVIMNHQSKRLKLGALDSLLIHTQSFKHKAPKAKQQSQQFEWKSHCIYLTCFERNAEPMVYVMSRRDKTTKEYHALRRHEGKAFILIYKILINKEKKFTGKAKILLHL